MATVDEILARQAYADDGEAWTRDNNYPSCTLYVEPEYVPVTNKRIADFNDQISVRGEQNTQFVNLQLPRYDDGLGLTVQRLYTHYQTVYGGSSSVPCNVSKSDSHVRMCWQVPVQATQEPEIIQMMMHATDTNSAGERVAWKTLPASYTTHDGLEIGGGIPGPNTSWYEQFVAQMEDRVGTAQGYANDAQASKIAAAGSATASVQSTTTSAQALADNRAYVGSQKETFVGYNRRETNLKYASALVGSVSGTTQVIVDDAWEGPVPGLEVAGKSEQGADPSPEYPQETVNTDVAAVTVTGASLFDDIMLMAYGNTTFVLSADRRQVTITGDKNYACVESDTPAQLIAGKSVTVSCNISNKNSEVPVEFQLYIEFPDGTRNYLHHKSSDSKTFSIPDNITKAIFKLFVNLKNANLDSKNTVVYSGVMVNIGIAPLPWEPCQSKTVPIVLTEPLRGIGDYRDEITMTNRIDRRMELTFDGSEDCWGAYTSGSCTGFPTINVLPISMNSQSGIYNQALVGGNEEAERVVLGSNNQDLYHFYCPFYDVTAADRGLSAWKAHFAVHPLKVVTYLGTPAETDLGADAIAAPAKLITYKGRTTTTVTAEGPEPGMTLEYIQDARMVIADLRVQINEIRNGGTT